jgi:hypothetical protein
MRGGSSLRGRPRLTPSSPSRRRTSGSCARRCARGCGVRRAAQHITRRVARAMADAPGTALRGALGASCGGHDCCAHGSGAAATAPAAEAGNVASWRDTLPWPCALGDGGGELLHGGDLDGDLLFAALASCGSPGAEEEWELRCKHIHTTAPSEQPGGAPQTTCHHTHVRVCKPGRARRGAGSGAAASEARGAAQPSAQGASRADAPAASAGNTAAAAEDGESSGGDDAPPERKRCVRTRQALPPVACHNTPFALLLTRGAPAARPRAAATARRSGSTARARRRRKDAPLRSWQPRERRSLRLLRTTRVCARCWARLAASRPRADSWRRRRRCSASRRF